MVGWLGVGPFHLDDLIGLGVQVRGGWAYSGLESMRARSHASLSQGEMALRPASSRAGRRRSRCRESAARRCSSGSARTRPGTRGHSDPRFQARDARPDLGDDAGRFVPEDHRQAVAPLPFHDVVVAVTDARSGDLDQYLVGLRRVNLDVFDAQWCLVLSENRGSCLHHRPPLTSKCVM